MTGKAVIINDVNSDHRYSKEMDDPNFKPGISHEARELLGMPIHSRTDLSPSNHESSGSEGNLPRAILLLINKKKSKEMVLPESIPDHIREMYE